MVKNIVFTPDCHVYAKEDDIRAKTDLIALHCTASNILGPETSMPDTQVSSVQSDTPYDFVSDFFWIHKHFIYLLRNSKIY